MNNKGSTKKTYGGEAGLSAVGNELTEKLPRHRRKRVKSNKRSDHKHLYEFSAKETVVDTRIDVVKTCTVCDREKSHYMGEYNFHNIGGVWYDFGWNQIADEDDNYLFPTVNFETQEKGEGKVSVEAYNKYMEEYEAKDTAFHKLPSIEREKIIDNLK